MNHSGNSLFLDGQPIGVFKETNYLREIGCNWMIGKGRKIEMIDLLSTCRFGTKLVEVFRFQVNSTLLEDMYIQ